MGAIITGLLPLVTTLFDRLIPDPEKRAQEQAAFISQLMQFAGQQDSGQNSINLEEARHRSVFVAGWRPFIGWVCGAGVCWAFAGEPIARFILAACGVSAELPTLDTSSMMTLITGLLGMAGFRTLERIQGVIPGTKR